MSLIRRIINHKENVKKDDYLSSANFIIYGSQGKSSLVASLTENDIPGYVIELTPAGGSSNLQNEYDKFISYPVSSLEELETVISSIHGDLSMIKKIGATLDKLSEDPKNAVCLREMEAYKKAITAKGDDWDEVETMAKKGELPFKAICLAEASVVSNWISERVEKKLNLEQIGADKSKLGMDWSALKAEMRKFYMRLLSIPVTTIISTSEILPQERQNLASVIPNLGIGSFGRELQEMVGNIFFTSFEQDGYWCYINSDNRKIFTKQKFKPVHTKDVLVEKINTTGNPGALWDYIKDFRKTKKDEK